MTYRRATIETDSCMFLGAGDSIKTWVVLSNDLMAFLCIGGVDTVLPRWQ